MVKGLQSGAYSFLVESITRNYADKKLVVAINKIGTKKAAPKKCMFWSKI